MREVGKDGRVVRLTKASWDITIPWDSDPNVAIGKMQARIADLEKQKPPSAPQAPVHGCNFDDKKIRNIVREEMESVIAPFTGG